MSFKEMESHIFLMPDYYLHFSCKMGKCRSACCVGWPISISILTLIAMLPICWCKWVLQLPTKSRLWFVCKVSYEL